MEISRQTYGYGYVRVSTDRQEELSPDSQEKLIRKYAEENHIILLSVFYELGISGRKADKRPQFQKMISLAKSPDHPVDAIIVWKFSRFARNQEESIVYKSLLKKQHNVEVISVSEPLAEGPFGSLIERIIEWMDEYYSIRLSGEVLRGMKEKALREGYQTLPPLGYRAAGGGKPFLIDEAEYRIVQYIFDRCDLDCATPYRIARELNDMGCRTRRGNPFELRTVKRILENPFYYGLVAWNGITFLGAHETRLSKSRYEQRMERLRRPCHPSRRRDVSACSHWLSGLLKCGFCGHTLAFSGRSRKSPGFQCCRYSKGLHPESHFISEKKAMAAVCQYLETLPGGMDLEYKYRPPKTETVRPLQKSCEDELAELASREARIRLAFENGVDTLEEYADSKRRLNTARKRLEAQLSSIRQSPGEGSPSSAAVLDRVCTICDLIKSPEVSGETKGNFLRGLTDDIVYDRKHHRIIFHLRIS